VPETDSYSGIRTVGQHTGTSSSFVQILSPGAGSPPLGGPILKMSGSALNVGATDPDIPTHLLAGAAGARAEVEYYFRVITSASILNVPILLPVNFDMHVTRTPGSAATAFTQWQVVVRRVFTDRDVAFDSGASQVRPPLIGDRRDDVGTEILEFNARNGFLSGEYYRVRMILVGNAGWDREAAKFGNMEAAAATGTFEAMLDPLPRVDPTFEGADQVTFEFSDNLFQGSSAAAAPEPGTLALLGVGVGGLMILVRRRCFGRAA
jgi:hypothetical protein